MYGNAVHHLLSQMALHLIQQTALWLNAFFLEAHLLQHSKPLHQAQHQLQDMKANITYGLPTQQVAQIQSYSSA